MNHHFNTYTLDKRFIFRAPLLPLSGILTSPFDEEFILRKLEDDLFLEAIYLASPNLFLQVQKLIKGEIPDVDIRKKLIHSLSKYLTRMSTRCTPFGLFALCGIGFWNDKNIIDFNKNHLSRKSRFDMDFLSSLSNYLVSIPSIQNKLLYFSNNTTYVVGKKLRFIENIVHGTNWKYRISSVSCSGYLEKVLDVAKKGAKLEDLSLILINEEVSLMESSQFIHEMVEARLLTSELEPTTNGEDYFTKILNRVGVISSGSNDPLLLKILNSLEQLDIRIKELDNCFCDKTERYDTIEKILQSIGVSYDKKYILQVDSFLTFKPEDYKIDQSISNKLKDVIGFLEYFAMPLNSPNLQQFIEGYLNRYEELEMPLLEALDCETGIGYPRNTTGTNSFVDNINFSKNDSSETIRVSIMDNFLFEKLLHATKNGFKKVEFSKADFDFLPKREFLFPPTVLALFKMLTRDDERIQFIGFGGSSSAANFIARFATGDKKINDLVHSIAVKEQDIIGESFVVAEITHLPESRIGNILSRPSFRKFEIPFLSKSDCKIDNQIPLDDLFVSIRNNKICLRSKRLNKEVLPRMTTAHNYSSGTLPVYKFLCDLQSHRIKTSWVGFNWGGLSSKFAYLPRAEYNNAVIFPATWRLQFDELKPMLSHKNPVAFQTEIKLFIKKWELPRFVVYKESDNELFIDFESVLSVEVFLAAANPNSKIELSEFLFTTNSPLINNESDSFTNEIAAIFYNYKLPPLENLVNSSPPQTKNCFKRSFIPGQECLYYKIYCGVKTADDILANNITPLINELYKNGLIEKWFFIRYADPDTHIRFRLFNSDIARLKEAESSIVKILQPLAEQGVISKIQLETYNRELERYGSNSILLAEDYFSVDSYATLIFLQNHQGDAGEEFKWQYALKTVVDTFELFNYPKKERFALLEKLKTAFIAEHSTDKQFKIQLDNKFRKLRPQVEALFQTDFPQKFASFSEILLWRKQQLQPIADQILSLKSSGALEAELDNLVASYMHMTINRIFKAKQRTHEMLIYDLLYRYYKSSMAREAGKSIN